MKCPCGFRLKPVATLLGVLTVGAEMTCLPAFAQEKSEPTLPDVLVTATRTAHAADDTPGASYVVTREQMDSRNLLGIDSALSTLPGVYNRRGKGLMDTLSAVTLRGMPDQKRTLILQDGMPLNDGYTGAVNFGGLPAEDFERVEVALGAGASLYGSNAMGGVVNLVTHMPDKREFSFDSGYGDGLGNDRAMHNLFRNYVSMGDKLDNGLRLFASFGSTHTNGYPSDLNVQSSKPSSGITGWSNTQSTSGAARYLIGARGDNDWSDNHAALRAAVDLPQRGQVRVSYQRNEYQYAYGQPTTYLRNSAGSEVWGYGSVREASFLGGAGEKIRDLYQASVDTAVGSARLKVNVGINDTGTNWYVTPGSTSSTTRNGGTGTLSSTPTRLNFGDAQLTFTPTSNQVLVVGASIRSERANTTESALSDWRDEDSSGATTYTAGGKARTLGLFMQDEIALTEKFTGSVGLRWDNWQTSDGYAYTVSTGNPISYSSHNETALSPKFGLVYRATSAATLRTSFGRAFRAPTVYELYRTWTSSTGVTYQGNPDLKPETANTFDIGGDFKPWKGAEVKATLYINRLHDMIYRRTISSTLSEYINTGKARGKGLELDWRQQLPADWLMLAGVTLNNTRIVENAASPQSVGKDFAMVPARIWHWGAEWKQGPWSFSGDAKHVSKRYANDDNSDSANGVYGSYDAYTVTDLKFGYRIDKNLKLSLSIDNLFNKNYYSYYQTQGRTYFLQLAGKF